MMTPEKQAAEAILDAFHRWVYDETQEYHGELKEMREDIGNVFGEMIDNALLAAFARGRESAEKDFGELLALPERVRRLERLAEYEESVRSGNPWPSRPD